MGGASPIFDVPAGATLTMALFAAVLSSGGGWPAPPILPGWVTGGGIVIQNYDEPTVQLSFGVAPTSAATNQLFPYDVTPRVLQPWQFFLPAAPAAPAAGSILYNDGADGSTKIIGSAGDITVIAIA